MRTILILPALLLSGLAWAVTPLLTALEFVPAESFLNDPVNSATFADVTAGFESFSVFVAVTNGCRVPVAGGRGVSASHFH